MTTPADEVRLALAAGRAAAQARRPVRANPYRGDADTARERVLARAWVRGYGNANPMPVDYSG
ncbi:hypothetical protein [Actinokineospora iranica]|uniref:Uncharacterized protein n=1 Tax=Actinokineospora iranica TaxID=1271860 RepID=A0A1G6Y813_9PSEU|nr:hypothetical protein [Actinokineospora iranica]SDD86490.1 hypothetical protein SAMN05216174_12077 [Actinokineospora iranica]